MKAEKQRIYQRIKFASKAYAFSKIEFTSIDDTTYSGSRFYEPPRETKNASQFDRRLFRSKVVRSAVDKRTKNNQALSLGFYLNLFFHRNLCFDRTDVWFRSERPSIETTFDRTDLIPKRKLVRKIGEFEKSGVK